MFEKDWLVAQREGWKRRRLNSTSTATAVCGEPFVGCR